MTSAVELVLARRHRLARAEQDAQRVADALLKAHGPRGSDGKQGPPGPKGDAPDHRWVGTALQFERPDGEWGDLVDLRGPKGARGERGAGGGAGAGIGVLTDLPLPVLDADHLVIQRAGRFYRVSVLQLKEVFGQASGTPEGALLSEGGDTLMTESGDYLVQE